MNFMQRTSALQQQALPGPSDPLLLPQEADEGGNAEAKREHEPSSEPGLRPAAQGDNQEQRLEPGTGGKSRQGPFAYNLY